MLRRYRSSRRMRPSTCVGFAPRRAISGMGQAGRRWMRRAARRWPWAGMAWWKTSRTCPVKVGDFDTDMRFICHEGLTEAFLLARGEPVARGAQKIADLGRGGRPCARSDRSCLAGRGRRTSPGASPASLTIWKASRTLVVSWSWSSMAFLLSLEGIQRRDLDTGAKVFAALGQPVLIHGARPSWDQVHSSGPWGGPPLASGLRCQ